MESVKIIQLTTKLMELTSVGKIFWELTDKSVQEEPVVFKNRALREHAWLSPNMMFNPALRWEMLTYRTSVENKVFKLCGGVLTDRKAYKFVRLQLWNSDNELEYEFPDNASFVDLFQLVHNFAADKAEIFVDKFLQNNELLETAG